MTVPFVQLVLDHSTVPADELFLHRVTFVQRCGMLAGFGRRVREETDDPLDLLLTQTKWPSTDRAVVGERQGGPAMRTAVSFLPLAGSTYSPDQGCLPVGGCP